MLFSAGLGAASPPGSESLAPLFRFVMPTEQGSEPPLRGKQAFSGSAHTPHQPILPVLSPAGSGPISDRNPSTGLCDYFEDEKPITCPGSFPSNSLRGNTIDWNVLAGVECVVELSSFPRKAASAPESPQGGGFLRSKVPRARYCSL